MNQELRFRPGAVRRDRASHDI